MAAKIWEGNDTGNVGDYSVAANWLPSGVPGAGDDVSIPAGSASITAGLGQSGVAIGSFRVEQGYTGTIGVALTAGSATQYLDIDPNDFYYAGSSTEAYIDLSIAAGSVDAEIISTGSPAAGKSALCLKGGTIDEMTIRSGSVGLARFQGETMTITSLRLIGTGATVVVGPDAGTLALVNVVKGTITAHNAITTAKVFTGGTLTMEGSSTATLGTCTLEGGTAVLNSAGLISTLTINSGIADLLQSGRSRTITTLDQNSGEFWYDDTNVTVTTDNSPGKPIKRKFVEP